MSVDINIGGEILHLRGSGAMYWATQKLLCVSDLHLGKSERIARRGGTLLPPYDTLETLSRLESEIDRFEPLHVICLGDSFDDLDAAHALGDEAQTRLAKLQAGRTWTWIEGNHDAGPVGLGGRHMGAVKVGALTFRHIAQNGANNEVSGHFHPKARIKLSRGSVSRPCFALDNKRLIMPAFGAYTGGLWTHDPAIASLFGPDAHVVLTGANASRFSMPTKEMRPK